MEIIDQIVQSAVSTDKNILIIGAPRSGSHALGSLINVRYNNIKYHGEICKLDGTPRYWEEIKKLYNHDVLNLAHLVQLSAKVHLFGNVSEIKKHTIIVNLKRNNKIKQFGSWMYFHRTGGVNRSWHNHRAKDMLILENSIEATDQDLDQFILEQMLDMYFLPDYVLEYENINFSNSSIHKNEYPFPIENIFSNLDYVTERLGEHI